MRACDAVRFVPVQIDERDYAGKYDFAGKTVRKLGISFSSEKRTIVDVKTA